MSLQMHMIPKDHLMRDLIEEMIAPSIINDKSKRLYKEANGKIREWIPYLTLTLIDE